MSNAKVCVESCMNLDIHTYPENTDDDSSLGIRISLVIRP
jgi:hypothetical protein